MCTLFGTLQTNFFPVGLTQNLSFWTEISRLSSAWWGYMVLNLEVQFDAIFRYLVTLGGTLNSFPSRFNTVRLGGQQGEMRPLDAHE